ncbi:hypothetical protein SPBR_04492 [Sporothrix brasiliensis 5110]|uniref:Uncharacterized protein n=1 Tax=Sporothrix brasiliensis 5110 TaxID=1398154 RepID=A0A0C2J428_9PEZI|nr:uncharacterized protein SPBR_04492 [Sporothrix brasiliensis 5110]KIH93755.1 hypothetical protein SPBR_04492 [Sporothrix brasiliensis 5110]
MPMPINEFIYIPPQDRELLRRLVELLQEYPDVAALSALSPSSPPPATIEGSTTTAKTAAKGMPTNKPLANPPSECVAALKLPIQDLQRPEATRHRMHATHYGRGGIKWTSLGHGFRYTPGPSVATPWQQWTWCDAVGQLVRCILALVVLCAAYMLRSMVHQ